MTEGGIGTVRIVTRQPLDKPEGYLAGSVQGVYSDLADEYDPKIRADRQQDVPRRHARRARCRDSSKNATSTATMRVPRAGCVALPRLPARGRRRAVAPTSMPMERSTGSRTFRATSSIVARPRAPHSMAWCSGSRAMSFELYFDSTYSRGTEKVSSMLMQLAGGWRPHRLCEFERGCRQHRRPHRTHQQRGVPDGPGVPQHQRRARARAVQRHSRRGVGQATRGNSTAV